MTAKEYRETIEQMGLSQRAVARLLEVDERTSRRYAAEGAPKVIALALAYLALRKSARASRLRRL